MVKSKCSTLSSLVDLMIPSAWGNGASVCRVIVAQREADLMPVINSEDVQCGRGIHGRSRTPDDRNIDLNADRGREST